MNLVPRIVRYGIVGTIVSAIYSVAVIVFVEGYDLPSPTMASVLAFAIIQPAAYFAHRRVTFGDAAPDPLQPWRFATTAVVTFSVATSGMYVLTEVLHRSYFIGIVLNWMLIPAANFLTCLIWVFRTGRVADAAGSVAAFAAGTEAAQIEQ